MAEAEIPVDLFNPGQVFACLGFLEAAEMLLGEAGGGFDWTDETDVKFRLCAAGEEDPVKAALEFLSEAKARALAPPDWKPKKRPKNEKERKKQEAELAELVRTTLSPSRAPETSSALPIQIDGRNGPTVTLTHWADSGTGRNDFKLYSGNRSAASIAQNLLSDGIASLWEKRRSDLLNDPLNTVCPMGGSFNFDPRGAWTTLDVGYSLNDLKHSINSSPAVEFFAAWGMENARPDEFRTGKVRYAVWGIPLPPILARIALVGSILSIPMRHFLFELAWSGKNRIVTFAEEEPQH